MATKHDSELVRLGGQGAATVCDLRLSTVNRVARLVVGDEAGLARVHAISNDGVELSSILDLPAGQTVRLDFSETVSMAATVKARDGKRYCLAFGHRINCAELLRRLVAEARSSRARPLRLRTPPMHARIRSLKGIIELELKDISQRGMRVRNDGSFEPGLPLWIRLPNGRECRGVVRWAGACSAGLQLLDVLSADELGAVTRLWSVPVSNTEPGSSRTAIPGSDCERSASDI
jgi:hypothetical protein